ncbi:hypothetical protein OOK58_38595 [Streptomyces sp. NBC_01728]|uniref:hypothetical protein n=1 Tax=unclassified Streptomyces TaxID=2593676 RepID=UPI0022596AF9|nr:MULTISPECIES: hypothetical protein [unclassified Streptomyces]MCX4457855.1 hypothetical protein [Streptomyces sp. NBC_01719]MCX4497212.1 hypothetical protein [Streptomyces sp. NBC_01728]
MRIRRTPALWIVAVAALGLLVGLLTPAESVAAGHRPDYLIKAKKEKPVPVSPVKGKAAKVPHMARWSAAHAHKTWPTAGTADLAVPAHGAAAERAAGLPVSIGAAKGSHRAHTGLTPGPVCT